jgi:hypothetical protein
MREIKYSKYFRPLDPEHSNQPQEQIPLLNQQMKNLLLLEEMAKPGK